MTMISWKMRLVVFSIFFTIGVPIAFAMDSPISITLQAVSEVIKVGTDTKIQIIMTNHGNAPVPILCKRVENICSGSDFDIAMIKPDQTEAMLTSNGLAIQHPPIVSIFSFMLNPGDSVQAGVTLNTLFNMDEIGPYTIQIHRVVTLPKGGVDVMSNLATITVTE
jgi:hypothetical protein